MARRKAQETIEVNQALMNVITPMGIEFFRNELIIGEDIAKVYGVIKYPQELDYGWLSKITNIPGTIVSLSFEPIDSGSFLDVVSKIVNRSKGDAETAKDALAKQRAIRKAENGEKMMKQIDDHGETIGLLSISIMPISRDDRLFEKVCRKVQTVLTTLQCKSRAVANLQKEGFKAISPFHVSTDVMDNVTQQPVPLSTFVGGFPFASSGYNDGSGYYFAKDSNDGLIILNPWKRGGDRTNSNMVIMGVPGVGKSTIIKHIAEAEYMRGTKIIFIDPEREYKDLCERLNGDWINAAGGKGVKNNPLQIRPVPMDDEEEEDKSKLYKDEGHGLGAMALHMKTLEVFFSLYLPELTNMQKAVLKDSIIKVYNKFNIFWDTDITTLKNTDYPIMSDLYEIVVKDSKDSKIHAELAILLKDIAMGSDNFIWNGHTTIETKSNCVVLDTLDLQNTSDTVKRTQYFNLLGYAWHIMSEDRNQPVMLFCDEGYLIIDPNVPQSLIFVRNVEKRARKYEAAVVVASHSVVDFLDPSIKMYGQAVLDTPCIKIIMGTDGQNLKETKDLYGLTEAEEELLAKKKRGLALLMVGSKRLKANFEIPEYKFEYMGKAGGR